MYILYHSTEWKSNITNDITSVLQLISDAPDKASCAALLSLSHAQETPDGSHEHHLN